MSFSQRQSWFKQNSGSMPEMTSHSPKENHSSTSSTQSVPCWVLTTPAPSCITAQHQSLAHLQTPRDSPHPWICEHCLYLLGFHWSRSHLRKQPRCWGDSEQGHSFPSTLQLHWNSCSAPVSSLLWFISHRIWDSAGGPELQPSSQDGGTAAKEAKAHSWRGLESMAFPLRWQ